MKKSATFLLPLFLWNAAAFAEGPGVQGPTEADLQACYGLEFQHETITPEVAFTIGECFTALADTLAQNNAVYYGFDSEPGELTNRSVVLHYAGSWYSHANEYGHPEAEAQLMLTWDQLAN